MAVGIFNSGLGGLTVLDAVKKWSCHGSVPVSFEQYLL